MKFRHLFAVLLAAISIVWSQSVAPPSQPIAAIKPVTDDYFGTKVVDPYRYMEDLKDPEVQAWFAGQNDYTRAVLANIPGRAQLLARISELGQSDPSVIAYRLPHDLYLIPKGKLYLRSGLNGQDRLLIDPDKITLTPTNQGKGKNAISNPRAAAVSGDGRYILAEIIPGGSQTNTELHVIDIASGRETGDVISHGVGAEGAAACWLPDSQSFVYGRMQTLPLGAAATEARQKFRSYLHVLGTDPEKDPPVFGYGVVACRH